MTHETTPALKNLKLALLAGTCLTTARAATVIESVDFSNTHAGAIASPLPFGTDVVTGNVTSTTDMNDFVAFTSLLPGSAFSIAFSGSFMNYDVFDSSNVHVGSPPSAPTGSSATFTGIVPGDGKLVAQVGYSEGNPYTINLTATTVPEPGSAALAGLGVAAAALRRTRRAGKAG